MAAEVLVFSHHDRIDFHADGSALTYRTAETWGATRAGIRAELRRRGQVLVVGNTWYVPWSPSAKAEEVPHWVVVSGYEHEHWHVADHFAARTPRGEQMRYRGWLTEEDFRALLTPLTSPTPEQLHRDRHALGTAVSMPESSRYRWLERATTALDPSPADDVEWIRDPASVLHLITRTLQADPGVLARLALDIWCASRHQCYRLAAQGQGESEKARAWADLPRAVQFAVEALRRGRRRTSSVEQVVVRISRMLEAGGTP
ncbi:hypothetical protein FHX82_001296 [Amycolatopsis bartoniae]|uniref:hypothetical protein n=1 Tax=Amycolatopsis bartoniae TaxID=941986 RepID=UPI00119811C7|nr:hypothetical protein [Amycolatopsis bartoniae]MBB2934276.1 hypothetical protein [Amycolatopsis bartoniae]TVT08475.1 hypothetical protein FNH07_12545 [Amycolatopsis bartoniae]